MSVKCGYVPIFISFWSPPLLAPKWWVCGKQHASTWDWSCGSQTNNPSSRRPKWGTGASGCGCLRSNDLLMHRSRMGNTRMSPFPGQPGLCRSKDRSSPPSLWRLGWLYCIVRCSNLVRSLSHGHWWSGPRHYGGRKWRTSTWLARPWGSPAGFPSFPSPVGRCLLLLSPPGLCWPSGPWRIGEE